MGSYNHLNGCLSCYTQSLLAKLKLQFSSNAHRRQMELLVSLGTRIKGYFQTFSRTWLVVFLYFLSLTNKCHTIHYIWTLILLLLELLFQENVRISYPSHILIFKVKPKLILSETKIVTGSLH